MSKTERIIADHGANLKRLSVAVLVDGMYEEQKSGDGKVQKIYIPRNKDDLTRIAGLVKQAIGIDESGNRNDGFEIQNVQFYEPSYEQEEASIKKEQQKEFILKMAKNGSLAITVLAFLMFMLRSMKKLRKTNTVVAQDAQNNIIKTRAKNANMPAEENTYEEEEKDSEARHSKLRSQIIQNVRKDPSLTANSLKKWITADLAVRE